MHYWRTTRCVPSCAAERGQCCQTAPDSTHARTDVGSSCQQQPLAHPVATKELLQDRETRRTRARSTTHTSILPPVGVEAHVIGHAVYHPGQRKKQRARCDRTQNSNDYPDCYCHCSSIGPAGRVNL